MIYLHDGTFDGFLTCVFEHYYSEKVEEIYSKESYEMRLLDEVKVINTDKEKANRVYSSIVKNFPEGLYWDAFKTFLSDNYFKDCYLLAYLVLAFKVGKGVDQLHTHKDAYNVKRLSRKVGMEKHRFLGIIRFMDTGEFLFSKIAPDNDILILIADHFADRFKNEYFVIYDERRCKAIISALGKWYINEAFIPKEIPVSKEEEKFRALWKKYFNTVGVEGRKNLKLQQAFVPLKYRKNILEFNQ